MKYIIYRLFNSNYEECYIGSTTNYKRRIICHRSNCNNINCKEYNYKVYKFIRENDGFDKWQFEILEELDCTKKELNETEGIFIEMFNSTLNIRIEGRSIKEYYIANIDKIREQGKQNYIANKDKIKEQRKQYRKLNKDKLKEQEKQYRELNKDKINERERTKINCICGSSINKGDKARHERTIKHNEFIK